MALAKGHTGRAHSTQHPEPPWPLLGLLRLCLPPSSMTALFGEEGVAILRECFLNRAVPGSFRKGDTGLFPEGKSSEGLGFLASPAASTCYTVTEPFAKRNMHRMQYWEKELC